VPAAPRDSAMESLALALSLAMPLWHESERSLDEELDRFPPTELIAANRRLANDHLEWLSARMPEDSPPAIRQERAFVAYSALIRARDTKTPLRIRQHHAYVVLRSLIGGDNYLLGRMPASLADIEKPPG